jgi:hypothetical protein
MSVCFNCAELGDDRVSARIYGQQCVWITQKPTTDDVSINRRRLMSCPLHWGSRVINATCAPLSLSAC